MNKNIVLLGGSGYVGGRYASLLKSRGYGVISISRSDLGRLGSHGLAAALTDAGACFLINAAGYTGKPNVDACELNRADCLYGNSVLPGLVAQACVDANVPWGHISSGCIFSGAGSGGKGFKEEDEANFSFRTNNCSFYSGSKALGEEVIAGVKNVYIWRLRIPFDNLENPRNYLTKLMRYDCLLEARNSISQLDEFVTATFACWEKHVPFGTYNVTNPGSVTTREVVEMIKKSGVCKKDFRFFESEEEFMKIAAKTPRSNCVLDSSKLASVGISMTPVHEAVEKALVNWVPATV
ncbi:RmlD substrate binding domain protein [mine drainage metagenome]|uniref:RmlD substrate binding domain protein n=1 Tax=mine drainage metagenome TaxID=410659 RepID=A0A1J5RJN1_9ZZZZ